MVRLKGFKKLVPVDEALKLFFEKFQPKKLEAERIPLQEALGRVAWENIKAEKDLPMFDRSTVDGYAVKAQDTFEASTTKPKTLRLSREGAVHAKEAVPVWTGNVIPKGADAVIMLEYTKKLDGKIEVLAPVTPGRNISKRGEDVKVGHITVQAGTILEPRNMGLLAALGFPEVTVTRKPLVGIVATGNELVELSEKPRKGQVFEVNRLILSGMCQKLGAQSIDLGIAKDEPTNIKSKIRQGLEEADLVLTTGGTSVGYADLVPATINQMGSPGVIVHGVAMRPGMPTALAVLKNKPVIVLSGNPVAAMIGFEVFAKPLLLKFLGVENSVEVKVKAKLIRQVAGVLGQRVFLRVRVFERDDEWLAEPVSVRGSGVLSTMTKANGYVIVPENREGLAQNETVTVHLFSF